MFASAHQFLKTFFERNLFERIVIYIFLSTFLVKVIFEFGLGQWDFVQSQNKQWLFYGFLALDYIFSVKKVVNLRVTVNPMSVFALVFLLMCVHGLFIGIMRHNPPFVILNDFIPPFMIALNILRMQSVTEYRPVDVRFLLTSCTLLAIGCTVFGLAGQMLGKPTGPSMGEGRVMIPLLMASLFILRPFPLWIAAAAAVMLAFSLPDMNRTTMAFLAVTVSGYVFLKTLRNPVHGVLAFLAAVLIATLAWTFIPRDSKTYERITSLTEIDLSERKGSIGERQAEWDAIREKLASEGQTREWLGLGFGGLYEVRFTHEYIRDYGHAHYAWAWFNLRFGQSGYIYLVLMLAALCWNAGRNLMRKDPQGVFVGFLSLMGLVYCVTHVNSVFLTSGLTFFQSPYGKDEK